MLHLFLKEILKKIHQIIERRVVSTPALKFLKKKYESILKICRNERFFAKTRMLINSKGKFTNAFDIFSAFIAHKMNNTKLVNRSQ